MCSSTKHLLQTRISLVLASLFVLLVTTGCNILYVPNAVHVPLFTKKNTLQTKAAYGLANTIDASAAYSLTDQMAVMALGSFAIRRHSEGHDNSHSHNYGEIAVGSYWYGDKWRVELYGGMGYGMAKAWWDNNRFFSDTLIQYTTEAEYIRLFGQINIGVEGEIFGGGIVFRPTYISFFNFVEREDGLPYKGKGASGAVLIEPTIFLRAGPKYAKVEVQATLFTAPLFHKSLRFGIEPFTMSLGVQFHF